MNVLVRQKIEAALAAKKVAAAQTTMQPKQQADPTQVHSVVEALLAGEKTYGIKDVMQMTGYSYNTICRHLRGRPGWLRNREGSIRLTETLVRSYLTDLAATGLADAEPA